MGTIVDVQDTEKGFSREAYNHIAGHAKLIGLHLIGSEFKVQPSFFVERETVKLAIDSKVISCTPDVHGGICVTIFEFTVRGKHARKDVFKCTAQLIAAYDIPEDSENDAAEAFCTKVGFFASYPYFRAHFAQVAASANAELPPLPILASVPHVANDTAKLKAPERLPKKKAKKAAAATS
ncbi:MAG TPA: hypothetical protein VGU01_05600 [Sphingomicrobium sp.]|nr:hypothetical protein [Sphingomicrobium sp.]